MTSTQRQIALLSVLAMALLLFAGCASAPPPVSGPPPVMSVPAPDGPEGKAVMTFYRKSRFAGAILNTSIHVDGIEIADLDNGTFVSLVVDPGPHKIYSDEEDDTTTIETEAHREYFFRIGLVMGVWKGHGILVHVPGEEGLNEFTPWDMDPAKDVRVSEGIIRSPSL